MTGSKGWWAGRESNPHSRRRLIYSQRSSPPAQPTHGLRLPSETRCLVVKRMTCAASSSVGADDGTRTRNRRFTKPLLYQLSYVGGDVEGYRTPRQSVQRREGSTSAVGPRPAASGSARSPQWASLRPGRASPLAAVRRRAVGADIGLDGQGVARPPTGRPRRRPGSASSAAPPARAVRRLLGLSAAVRRADGHGGPPALGGGLEQQDRARDRGVERPDLAPHRDAHGRGRYDAGCDPRCPAPRCPRRAPADRAGPTSRKASGAVTRRRRPAAGPAVQVGQAAREVVERHHQQVLHGARGCLDGGRARWAPTRRIGNRTPCDAARLGTAQQRAHVLGVLQRVEHQHEGRLAALAGAGHDVVEVGPSPRLHDQRHALVAVEAGERGQRATLDLDDRDAQRGGVQHQLVERGAALGHHQQPAARPAGREASSTGRRPATSSSSSASCSGARAPRRARRQRGSQRSRRDARAGGPPPGRGPGAEPGRDCAGTSARRPSASARCPGRGRSPGRAADRAAGRSPDRSGRSPKSRAGLVESAAGGRSYPSAARSRRRPVAEPRPSRAAGPVVSPRSIAGAGRSPASAGPRRPRRRPGRRSGDRRRRRRPAPAPADGLPPGRPPRAAAAGDRGRAASGRGPPIRSRSASGDHRRAAARQVGHRSAPSASSAARPGCPRPRAQRRQRVAQRVGPRPVPRRACRGALSRSAATSAEAARVRLVGLHDAQDPVEVPQRRRGAPRVGGRQRPRIASAG